MKKLILCCWAILLAGCGSNPVSYLPSGTKPIVNVEADINEKLSIKAKNNYLQVSNLTAQHLHLRYKLFWYDVDGVTQIADEQWQKLWLEALQTRQIPLSKPNDESVNYRFYLKNND